VQPGKTRVEQAARALEAVGEVGVDAIANDLLLGWNQLLREGGLQFSQTAALQQFAVAVDLRNQSLLRRHGEDLVLRQIERPGTGIDLPADLGADLLRRLEFVPQGVDLVENYDATLAAAASRRDVLAPDRQVGLGDAGIGSQDEQHRMRVRQQRQGQFGFGTDGIEAGRVENHQPLLKQRMREIDHRVPPAGNLDTTVLTASQQLGVAFGKRETEVLGNCRRYPDDVADVPQRLLHGFGGGGVDRHDPPLVGKSLVLTDAGLPFPGLDRQQFDRRRLAPVEQQLGRTHRRPAGGRRQNTVAVAGKEDGVDQFRFAARELGDECHLQTVLAQLVEQAGDATVRLRIVQLVVEQPARELPDDLRDPRAPFAVGGKVLGKRHGSSQDNVGGGTLSQSRRASPSGRGPLQLPQR